MTNYTKGGRGKTAPYKTTHCRIPEAVKPICEQVSAIYKELLDSPTDPKAEQYIENCQLVITEAKHQDKKPVNELKSKDEALEIAKKIIKSKKSVKISLAKIISEIYQIEIKPEEL